MKHLLTGLALSLLLVSWSPPPADAAASFFNARVIRVGVTQDGTVVIRLTDLGSAQVFRFKNFLIPDLVSKEMLAIGLSAVAANLSVTVRTDPAASGLPLIRVMYLRNQ